MKQNKLTSSRQSRKKNISDAYDAFKMATLHKKPRKIAAWNHGKTA